MIGDLAQVVEGEQAGAVTVGPDGRVAFVEIKRPDGELRTIQSWQHDRLLKAGAEVWTLWSTDDVDAFVRGL